MLEDFDEIRNQFYEQFVKYKPISKMQPNLMVDEIGVDNNGILSVIHHTENGNEYVRPLVEWAEEFEIPLDIDLE